MKFVQLSILAGAFAIALAILFVDRWQITPLNRPEMLAAYRLDKWTGEVSLCSAKQMRAYNVALGFGVGLNCAEITHADLNTINGQHASAASAPPPAGFALQTVDEAFAEFK